MRSKAINDNFKAILTQLVIKLSVKVVQSINLFKQQFMSKVYLN